MTAIMQALGAGYGEEEILKFLSKNSPSLAKSISKAKSTGYSVSNILSFLDKTMKDDEFDPYLSQEAGHKKVANQRERKTKQFLKSAATTGALIGAGRAIPSAIQGIKGAFQAAKPPPIPASPTSIPGTGTSATSNIGPRPMSGAPITPPPVNASSPVAPGTPVQPQNAQQVQQPQQNAPPVDSAQIIENMGIGSQVKNLAEAGNDPEAIATAVGISLKPHQKKWLEDQMKAGNAKPLAEMISDFLANPVSKEKKPPEVAENVQKVQESPQFAEFLKPYRESKAPEKGMIAATPDGEVGDVKDIRKTEALVNEDGKLHKLKIGDLKLPDEKIQQTVSRLLEMPEVEKSSIINYWSYDPEDKELFLMFHNGETYKYLDVPEELEEELLEASTAPKTKGQNEFGAWSQEDPQSRGATFINKLIANPKYKKSGKGEKPNPYYRKLRKGYDYWSKLRK